MFDNDKRVRSFFGFKVKAFDEIEDIDFERIILTGFMKREEHHSQLLKAGIPQEKNLIPGAFMKTASGTTAAENLGFVLYNVTR